MRCLDIEDFVTYKRMRSMGIGAELITGSRIYSSGVRRSGVDRRTHATLIHFPERRSDIDRRSGFERRSTEAVDKVIPFRRCSDRPEFMEAAEAVQQSHRAVKGIFWGLVSGSLIWAMIILALLWLV
jgi:hypothetical protein